VITLCLLSARTELSLAINLLCIDSYESIDRLINGLTSCLFISVPDISRLLSSRKVLLLAFLLAI